MAEPRLRVAAGAHSPLPLRQRLRAAAHHADVLSRRSPAGHRSDLQQRARGRAQAPDRRPRPRARRRGRRARVPVRHRATRAARHADGGVSMAKPTPSQTVGPFFARELLWKDGGTVLFAGRGDRITLTGRVFDGNGAPIYDALFETWQADATGKFPAGHDGSRPYGYGRVSTDTDGRYAIGTIMPRSFKGPGGATHAPQVSVAVFARGVLKALQPRVFLAPLELIKDDPLARAIGDL